MYLTKKNWQPIFVCVTSWSELDMESSSGFCSDPLPSRLWLNFSPKVNVSNIGGNSSNFLNETVEVYCTMRGWMDSNLNGGNPRFTQIGWEFDIFLFDPGIPSLKLKVPRFEGPKKHKKSNVPNLKRKGGMGWRFIAKALIEISSKCQGD